jgi:hypothetical protein
VTNYSIIIFLIASVFTLIILSSGCETFKQAYEHQYKDTTDDDLSGEWFKDKPDKGDHIYKMTITIFDSLNKKIYGDSLNIAIDKNYKDFLLPSVKKDSLSKDKTDSLISNSKNLKKINLWQKYQGKISFSYKLNWDNARNADEFCIAFLSKENFKIWVYYVQFNEGESGAESNSNISDSELNCNIELYYGLKNKADKFP